MPSSSRLYSRRSPKSTCNRPRKTQVLSPLARSNVTCHPSPTAPQSQAKRSFRSSPKRRSISTIKTPTRPPSQACSWPPSHLRTAPSSKGSPIPTRARLEASSGTLHLVEKLDKVASQLTQACQRLPPRSSLELVATRPKERSEGSLQQPSGSSKRSRLTFSLATPRRPTSTP